MHRYVYRVSRQCTMQELADQFGTSVRTLMQDNDLGSEEVYVGMRLLVGGEATRTHVVRPFETLDAIARQYHTSVQEIVALNRLQSQTVFLGQPLRIPVQVDGGSR